MSILTGLVPSASLKLVQASMAKHARVTHRLDEDRPAMRAAVIRPVAVPSVSSVAARPKVGGPGRSHDMAALPRVRAYLREHADARPRDIAAALGLPREQVYDALHRLRKTGDEAAPAGSAVSRVLSALKAAGGPMSLEALSTATGVSPVRLRKTLNHMSHTCRLESARMYWVQR